MADAALCAWTTAWWDRWPGRLEFELQRLEAAGYAVRAEDRSSGLLVLTVHAPNDKTSIGDIALTITFPDTYPFTAPQVQAPQLGLDHHQHPFGGTLCLIGRSTIYWDSTCHLAQLLDDQLRKSLVAGAAKHGTAVGELDQAEPFASYYTYVDAAAFLVDAMPEEFEVRDGEATFLLNGPIPPTQIPGGRTLGVIESMRSGRSPVYEAGNGLRMIFGGEPARVAGRWVLLDSPPNVDNPAAIWKIASDADSQGVAVANLGDSQVQLRAVGFRDELSRTRYANSWFVVARRAGSIRRNSSSARRSGNPARRALETHAADSFHLVQVDRAGRDELTQRSALTADTSNSSTLVLGCGAIGSVLIDHLARAGVGRLILVDRDRLEPGNITRHAGSFHGVGLSKVVAMAQHVLAINPHADVVGQLLSIGDPMRPAEDGRLASELLASYMAEVDLVVDASAEVGVQELTADMARALRKPWLMLSATEGAAGGTVVLIDPQSDACFSCFQWHRAESSIPFPPAITGANIQPMGCTEPTFVGAGFDLAEVALQAARVTVARLLRDRDATYPEEAGRPDAWILALRSDSDDRIAPEWTTFSVVRHPSCMAHD